jgi:hypothetical protein
VLDRPGRMLMLATVVAAILGIAAGCGDDDDDMAAETTTTEAVTTTPVEDSLQQAVDDAFSSCRDAAADVGGGSPLGEEACEEVARSLEREIAGLSASAREDVDAALKELSAKCRNLAGDLPEATQEFGLTACDQLAAGG